MIFTWSQYGKAVLLAGVLGLGTTSATGQTFTNAFDQPLCKKSVREQVSGGGIIIIGPPDGTVVENIACEVAPGETSCTAPLSHRQGKLVSA